MSYFNVKIYENPVWHGLTKDKIIALSDEDVENLRIKQEEINAKNKEIQKTINTDLLTIKSLTKKYFGEYSKEYKYVSKFSKSNPYYGNDFNRMIIEQRQNYQKEIDKQNREKELKIAKDKLLTDAIAYLISKGKNIGTDFTAENAIDTANDLAYAQEIERKQELGRAGTLFPFSGDDNCENCGGWDGISNRCECGNRRVDWVSDYFDFRNPYIYGEAY